MSRRPRGTGSVYKQGPAWSLRIGSRASRKYETGFRTKAEAERRLALMRAEAMQKRLGVAADPRLTPTLADLAGPWLERRKATHKAAAEDRYRWDKHLAPWFGHLRPDDVDHARIRAFAEAKLDEGLASGTVRVCVAVLSALFVDLLERGLARANPARGLPRSLARMIRPSHDPKTTPFLERLEDVRRVFLFLPPPLNIGFALGAFAGLRPGEAFALRWPHVDLASRRIHVRESVTGALKDKDSRVVPILDALHPVLGAWRLRSSDGRVVPPLRCDGNKIDKGTRGEALREALRALHLERPGLAWYECTRHTFASHWVLGGGSIEKLSHILGHASITQTQVYAHLRPDLYAEEAYGMLPVSLEPGSVAHFKPQTAPGDRPSTRKRKRKTGAAL